jgi:5,5'-dehydrodivanillate O-demethylase oxygenase subunit
VAVLDALRAAQETGEPEWMDYIHTAPGTLAGRYLRRFWQPIYIASDLAPGRSVPIRIMSEDLTLYRGESGTAHLVAFRCAHRGTQLSTGWVEGDELRCFYHGWKYGPDGQCTEQPAEPEPFCQRIRIRSYPTWEYIGLIWAYLGDDDPPPFRLIPAIDREDGFVDIRPRNVLPINYANSMENDPAHVPFVHREAGHAQEIPYVDSVETEYGICDRMENVTVLNRRSHRIMPNCRVIRAFTAFPPEYGWAIQLSWQVPVDDESHIGFNVRKMFMTKEGLDKYHELRPVQQANATEGTDNATARLAAQVLRGEIDPHGFDRKTPSLVQLQDLISQWGQGSTRDRATEHLGRSDAGVMLWRRIWQRELRALAEGRPLTQWTIPEQFDFPRGDA